LDILKCPNLGIPIVWTNKKHVESIMLTK